jgi:hypothetical protein
MHCCRAFELASELEGCDVFARFSNEQYVKVGPAARAH